MKSWWVSEVLGLWTLSRCFESWRRIFIQPSRVVFELLLKYKSVSLRNWGFILTSWIRPLISAQNNELRIVSRSTQVYYWVPTNLFEKLGAASCWTSKNDPKCPVLQKLELRPGEGVCRPAKSSGPAGGLLVLTKIPRSPGELRSSHGKLTWSIKKKTIKEICQLPEKFIVISFRRFSQSLLSTISKIIVQYFSTLIAQP